MKRSTISLLAFAVDDPAPDAAAAAAPASCSRAPTARGMMPSALRSSGPNPIPAPIASRGDCSAPACRRRRIVPASTASAPKTARAVSERPDPSSPARPDDLTPAQLDSDDAVERAARRRRSPASSTVGADRRLGRADCRAAPLGLGQLAAEHRRDQLVAADSSAIGALGDGAPVAHHGDPVADGVELVEPVGDEDDRHALARAAADDVEQDADLVLGERRRRLVHDHELGLGGQRAGDARSSAGWRWGTRTAAA